MYEFEPQFVLTAVGIFYGHWRRVVILKDIGDLQAEMTKSFGEFRIEMAKSFNEIQGDI